MDGYKERMAENIRQAREAKDLGRGEVADKVGVSPRTVERWEEAESKPHPATLRKLAELFEVDTSDLKPDTPPEAETLERIEAKLDRLLTSAGLSTLLDDPAAELDADEESTLPDAPSAPPT